MTGGTPFPAEFTKGTSVFPAVVLVLVLEGDGANGAGPGGASVPDLSFVLSLGYSGFGTALPPGPP